MCESGWRDGRSNEADWRGGEDGPASDDAEVVSIRAMLPELGDAYCLGVYMYVYV